MNFLLIGAVIFAVMEWFFEYKKNKLGIYLTKPTVMLFLIAWVWIYVDAPMLSQNFYTSSVIWFVLGLVFCLGGDVFLMFPERFFLPGLISFLLGHICYIIGFGIAIPPPGNTLIALLIAILLAIVAGWVYIRLANGMQVSGKEGMRLPVLFYTVVIVLMLYSALMTIFSYEWSVLPSILVSVGAFLFLISDIMNAWVRFVSLIQYHRLWIMSTYHLAQICIAVGAAIHFSRLTPMTL